MSSAIKLEFLRWVESIPSDKVSKIDCKLLNILIEHFDTLLPLGTAGGNRAKKLKEIIQSKHLTISDQFPEVESKNSSQADRVQRINGLEVGPFRGFSVSESFKFDKKYTFMYGPNGSGKSSFCEALEYALLGGIEEADAKRIPIHEYIKNAHKGNAVTPVAYGTNGTGAAIAIPANQDLYRFAFIEKNRIDGFARITATTASAQKDRIATLFGLDAFSNFVDGFTDDFERYLELEPVKATAFKSEEEKIRGHKELIETITKKLQDNDDVISKIIIEISREEIKSKDDLITFLNGSNGSNGFISQLQLKQSEQIPEDLQTSSFDSLIDSARKIAISLKQLSEQLEKLSLLSSDVNYKDLYSAIKAIRTSPDVDPLKCPACKTPISDVSINPFDNAQIELEKLSSLAELQTQIIATCKQLSLEVRATRDLAINVNTIGTKIGYKEKGIPLLTEFHFDIIGSINSWKPLLESELADLRESATEFEAIKKSVLGYNTHLAGKRKEKSKASEDLLKFQLYRDTCVQCEAIAKEHKNTKDKTQEAIDSFLKSNSTAIKEIKEESERIDLWKQYVNSYNRLITHLKTTRNSLPSKLSIGLSLKVMEYYNIINAHDPDFEMLAYLILPSSPGEKIKVTFKEDPQSDDALQIMSEGHIKVLGLSILLAKAIHQGLTFLIFDDIVNAIDDDHRGGIAELLLKHSDLNQCQHIVTCHGETFLAKLEHTLGQSAASANVTSYRFVPADSVAERGVKIVDGNPKHNLSKAKNFLAKDERKEAASSCRRAVEVIAYQLWKKLVKHLNLSLMVAVRGPSANPDLYSVIDGLIKAVGKISGLSNLQNSLIEIKEKYSWSILNKGVHEDEEQTEFDRNDIAALISLIETIEQEVSSIRIATSAASTP